MTSEILLKDDKGRLARVLLHKLPLKLEEVVYAAKYVGGKVIKDKGDTQWPENELAVPYAQAVRNGIFIQGYRNENFELMARNPNRR